MSDLKGTFKGKHVLTVKQFNREQCDYIFEVAASMKKKMEAGEVIDALKGKLLALMFYEVSIVRVHCAVTLHHIRARVYIAIILYLHKCAEGLPRCLLAQVPLFSCGFYVCVCVCVWSLCGYKC